jgi:hypothetical protein
VFNREWLNISEYQVFLKEYKFDSSQATCVVCNQPFSIHYRGKADIDNHMKIQKHQKNMKSYNVNQHLIIDTIKPSKKKMKYVLRKLFSFFMVLNMDIHMWHNNV